MNINSNFTANELFRLGMMFDKDLNHDLSKKYLEEASMRGHPRAMFELSFRYFSDNDKENFIMGLEWMQESAHTGFGPALKELIMNVHLESDEERDLIVKAKEWFTDPAHYSNGNLLFQFSELLFFCGERKDALIVLTESANLDNSTACFMLGVKHLNQEIVRANLDEALTWLVKSGNLYNSESYRTLGDFYFFGGTKHYHSNKRSFRIEPDYKKALYYYEKAIELGDTFTARIVGRKLLSDEYLAKDAIKAEKYILTSAEFGSSEAMVLLGQEYLTGENLSRNIYKGIFWLTNAVKKGSFQQAFNLCEIYAKGEMVILDIDEAINWFKIGLQIESNFISIKEAEKVLTNCNLTSNQRSNIDSILSGFFTEMLKLVENNKVSVSSEIVNKLANFYELGIGTAIDNENAKYWYSVAAELGSFRAKKKLFTSNKIERNS